MSNESQAFVDTGITYLEKANYNEALENFRLALALDGKDVDALVGKGLCLLRLGDAIKGFVDINKAASLGSEAARELLQREGVARSPGWGRYGLAVFLCFMVLAVWNIVGVAVFRWKHGGGALGVSVGFLLVYGVWRFLMKRDSEAEKQKLNGVRGWLGLFCMQSFFGGAFIVLHAVSELEGLYFFLGIGYGMWAISTGVLLVKKTEKCIFNAKVYLVVSMILLFVMGISGGQAVLEANLINILLSVVWLVYFFVSKRVRITYAGLG